MKISLAWLNTYLDRPVDAEEAERVLTNVGFPLDGIEPVDGDQQLDVEVTSNRSDCLSHIGVAREIAAATGRTLRTPRIDLPKSDATDVLSLTSVENHAPELCLTYTARVIRGVKIGPSPDWLKQRLAAIGLRPVNNVVDITNFVLHEMGQPLHAFDMNKLAGKRIVVRRATSGESFTAIDGSRHKLRDTMLVIADADRPVAIAGIMGGLDSEVSDSTTDILLESARFAPLNVRSTSRSMKLASDSSYRFERGIDQEGIERASRRAAQLIVELAGGKLADGVITVGGPAPMPAIVTLRPDRCNALLGLEIPAPLMVRILGGLGLSPQLEEGLIACTIPSHRLDLSREVDLIEEIARLHGFDHLPVEQKIHVTARPPQQMIEARKRVASVLVAHGFCQTITFSFLPTSQAEAFADGLTVLKVDEEKKKAEPALRPSLLASLLACRKTNQDAGNHNVRLFEIGQTFAANDAGFVESRRLALLADAEKPAEAMRAMRGTIEELLVSVGMTNRYRIIEAPMTPTWAAPAAAVIDARDAKRVIGMYGLVSAAMLKSFDLQTPVVLAELDYPSVVSAYPAQPTVGELPRYPAIERDLSVIVEEATAWAAIEKTICEAKPALLETVNFVTVYRGKPIEKGRKSVTLRMTFRDPSRTLEHDEVSGQMQSVIGKLRDELGATLRD